MMYIIEDIAWLLGTIIIMVFLAWLYLMIWSTRGFNKSVHSIPRRRYTQGLDGERVDVTRHDGS